MPRLFLVLHTLVGPLLAAACVLLVLTFGMAQATPLLLIGLAVFAAGLPIALYASRGRTGGAAERLTDPQPWLSDRMSGL